MGRNAERTKVGTRALVENFPAPRRLPGGERDKAGEFGQGRINPDRALRAAHLELHPSPRTIASRRVMVEPQRAHLIPGNTCTQRPARADSMLVQLASGLDPKSTRLNY